MTLAGFIERARRGRFFTVAFVKRTNGEERVMNCRMGVRSHLSGGELAYDPAKRNLLVVFDTRAGGYRMVNLEQPLWVHMDGRRYNWNGRRFVQEREERT